MKRLYSMLDMVVMGLSQFTAAAYLMRGNIYGFLFLSVPVYYFLVHPYKNPTIGGDDE